MGVDGDVESEEEGAAVRREMADGKGSGRGCKCCLSG